MPILIIACAMPIILSVGMLMIVKMFRALRTPQYPAMPVYDASFTVFPIPIHEVAMLLPGEALNIVGTDYSIYRRTSADY